MDWQPIDTAPKDGSFLVQMDNGEMHVAKVHKGARIMIVGGAFSFDRTEKPTHWMPLPAPVPR